MADGIVPLASHDSEALSFGQHAVALGAHYADNGQLALCRCPRRASVPPAMEGESVGGAGAGLLIAHPVRPHLTKSLGYQIDRSKNDYGKAKNIGNHETEEYPP